jgi:hypothetical protein
MMTEEITGRGAGDESMKHTQHKVVAQFIRWAIGLIDDPEISWAEKYKEIFAVRDELRISDYTHYDSDYYDPDCDYKDDIRAYVSHLERTVLPTADKLAIRVGLYD